MMTNFLGSADYAPSRPMWVQVSPGWQRVPPVPPAKRARPALLSMEEKVADLRARQARRTELKRLLLRKDVPDEIARLIFCYTGYDMLL